MITFQRSISFSGDTDDLPSVQVTIEVPRLAFSVSEDVVTRRYATPGASATFEHPTGDKKRKGIFHLGGNEAAQSTYRITVPGELLADDSTETQALAIRYFAAAFQTGDLDAFALPVAVAYRALDGQLLGTSEFSVLAIPAFASGILAEASTNAAVRPPMMDSLVLLDRAKLLTLLDRAKLLARRAGVEELLNDSVLLLAVLGCTRLDDDIPSFSEAGAEQVSGYLERQGMSNQASAMLVAAIESAYPKLVDIELEIPDPQPLEIGGTLTISAPAGVKVVAADFLLFLITARWVDASNGRPQVPREFQFTDQITVTKNSADFSLTDTETVYRSAVQGDVVVAVTGSSGSGAPLWTRTFRADDPGLAKLDITVARQVTGTLTTLDAPPKDPNLRLRGRVVVLHPNCAVKDLLVFVEVKAAKEADWHVVGAATADDGGNFSVPYPYGTYVEARARCSAAPRTSANISIVSATGVRTISEDFLYLLVENALVPDKPCGDEDCGCRDRKAPGRLPDFEDLIGSDVYSQDLGTGCGCINLSTPNRTINEHNFQAIVRMSDPQVATYQLSRHELGLDEIDIAQVAALVSGAAVLRERATTASAIAVTQDPAGNNQLLLNAVMTAYPRALAVAAALPSSGSPEAAASLTSPLQQIDAAAVASAKSDLVAIIATLEAARNQLATAGGNLSPTGDGMLDSAHKLKGLLDRGPYLFELDYVQQVANLARALVTLANAALDYARLNAHAPPRTSQALQTAIQNIDPHVQAVATALAQGGPPITLSALAKVYTHLDAVTSILQVAFAQLVRDGVGVPATPLAVVEAAHALQPLVDHAIDTAGTSVRYELTVANSTRTRQPVGLTNPIEWQRAPEGVTTKAAPVGKPQAIGLDKGIWDKGAKRLPPAPLTEPEGTEGEFAQAVSVATGHILQYKVAFKADGYSLGDVVYSLPLAPGQKKQIVVFDSSQRLLGAESQQLRQNERLAMGLVDERDITSQLAGNLSEALRGSSSANTSGISAGFGTGGQGSGGGQGYGGSGSAVLGVAGGVAQASSDARQDSSRDVAQFFGEKLRQAVMQNAEGYRALNASVVTTVQQGQRYAVTSEVIANHNHCHSLTMMYFEVLRHYAIFQELASVDECLFVPLLLARFSVDNIAAWRDVLAPALLPMPSETYLQPFVAMAGSVREHPLIKGFDAVQRLRTSYANVDMPAGSYDEEPIRFMKGSLQLRVNLPRPKTRYDRIKSLPVVNRAQTPNPSSVIKSTSTAAILAGLTGGLSLLFTGPGIEEPKVVQAKEQIFDAFMSMDANFENVPPANCIRVNNFRPVTLEANGYTATAASLDLFEDGKRDKEHWEQYSRLLGYTDVIDMLEYYFRGRLIAEWDDIFHNDIVPLVFDELIDNLRLSEFATDVTALRRYNGGEQRITVNISGTTNKSRSQLPRQLKLTVAGANAKALHSYVTFDVEDVTLNYSTAHYNGPLYSGSVGDALLDDVDLDIPERPDEQRNPRREDRYVAAALIEHLNNNLEHYNRVLWTRLDPDRRFMLLDGFAIQVYDAEGHPVLATDGGVRSLASVVKNEVITVAGNSLVLPVAPGYRVSGALIEAIGSDGKRKQVSLFDHYKPLTPVKPYRVSVPTPGVFAEAVQGQCNACERIETNRLQDWSRFPIDEPTPIAPVTLPTPTPQDWQAAWREFASPMVNIQNAPGMPAPGAGLAGLSDALTTSGVFKDITGLDANQQNALKTYLSNQENAKAFAEMAKEMATQSHNTQNSPKIMDQLKAAKDGGALDQDEYSKLVKQHMQQQIDGGQSAKAEAKGGKPSITKAIVDTANRGGNVRGFKSDREGIESIESGDIVFTAGGRAPAQTTGVGGVVTQRPPASSAGTWSKLIDWASKLATAALASKEDELGQALTDAALEIAAAELSKGVDAIPFGKALKLTVRYSTVFAEAAGIVIDASRTDIQNLVDEAVKFSGDNGLTPEDAERLQQVRSHQAIAIADTVKALEAGLASTVETILHDATDVLAEAAGDITSQITGKIAGKLLSAARVDRAWLDVVQAVEDNVPAARLKLYQKLGVKLVRLAIASFADSKANRARLEALLVGAAGDDALVGLLRSLVEIGVVNLAQGVKPLDGLFPPGSEMDTITLGKAVEYEAKRAAKAVIDELKQAGWTFGSHAGYSGIQVNAASKNIDLPSINAVELEYGPTAGDVLGLLEDDLADDEQALASVYDGLQTTLMLRAAAYQAAIDAAPSRQALGLLAAGEVGCQEDAVAATLALRDAATGLRSRYAGTALQAQAQAALAFSVIPPAVLREPRGSAPIVA